MTLNDTSGPRRCGLSTWKSSATSSCRKTGGRHLQCSSKMVLMALNRADECLSYMAGVKEQSIFNFVATPQSMAIATFELCFQSQALFRPEGQDLERLSMPNYDRINAGLVTCLRS